MLARIWLWLALASWASAIHVSPCVEGLYKIHLVYLTHQYWSYHSSLMYSDPAIDPSSQCSTLCSASQTIGCGSTESSQSYWPIVSHCLPQVLDMAFSHSQCVEVEILLCSLILGLISFYESNKALFAKLCTGFCPCISLFSSLYKNFCVYKHITYIALDNIFKLFVSFYLLKSKKEIQYLTCSCRPTYFILCIHFIDTRKISENKINCCFPNLVAKVHYNSNWNPIMKSIPKIY